MIATELRQELDKVTLFPLPLMLRTEKSRDAGERGHCPCPFISGATGTEVPFHRSIMGNCMVYQDRLETYLLAATPRNFRVVFCN